MLLGFKVVTLLAALGKMDCKGMRGEAGSIKGQAMRRKGIHSLPDGA